MEMTNLESFLGWSEEADAEFPELQYSLAQSDHFNWDEFLDQYLDPINVMTVNPTLEGPERSLDLPGVNCIQELPVGQCIEELPELSLSPKSEDWEIHNLNESLVKLQERVDLLENRLSEKQKKIEALETYVNKLQPFLQQLCNSIGDIHTGGVA